MRIFLIAPALALSLACVAPAQAATENACREVFAKMSANGKTVTDKKYVAMMKKSGRKMARSTGASQDVVYEAGEARGPAALRVGRP